MDQGRDQGLHSSVGLDPCELPQQRITPYALADRGLGRSHLGAASIKPLLFLHANCMCKACAEVPILLLIHVQSQISNSVQIQYT